MIELPEGVEPGVSVKLPWTSVPDVWRNYAVPTGAEIAVRPATAPDTAEVPAAP